MRAIVPSLPKDLPSVRSASLPVVYESAKTALAECARVDECKDWADKAAALASYAKQADDDALEKMALKIRVRAIDRCGALLREIAPKSNHHDSTRDGADPSRKRAAEDAGLSERQRKTALRINSIPREEFESLVESENPPTLTEMAERGKKAAPKPAFDLQGRDPKEFSASTDAQGRLRDAADMMRRIDVAVAVRGAFVNERKSMRKDAVEVLDWCRRLITELEKTDDE